MRNGFSSTKSSTTKVKEMKCSNDARGSLPLPGHQHSQNLKTPAPPNTSNKNLGLLRI